MHENIHSCSKVNSLCTTRCPWFSINVWPSAVGVGALMSNLSACFHLSYSFLPGFTGPTWNNTTLSFQSPGEFIGERKRKACSASLTPFSLNICLCPKVTAFPWRLTGTGSWVRRAPVWFYRGSDLSQLQFASSANRHFKLLLPHRSHSKYKMAFFT